MMEKDRRQDIGSPSANFLVSFRILGHFFLFCQLDGCDRHYCLEIGWFGGEPLPYPSLSPKTRPLPKFAKRDTLSVSTWVCRKIILVRFSKKAVEEGVSKRFVPESYENCFTTNLVHGYGMGQGWQRFSCIEFGFMKNYDCPSTVRYEPTYVNVQEKNPKTSTFGASK